MITRENFRPQKFYGKYCFWFLDYCLLSSVKGVCEINWKHIEDLYNRNNEVDLVQPQGYHLFQKKTIAFTYFTVFQDEG